jgi:ligand-binding sensor domain-containing protein
LVRRIRFVTGVCVLALLCAVRARADEPLPTLLSGFNLTSWTQKDGITFPLLWSLAQDDTGYLWLGTEGGLLRFDGIRFVRWDELAAVPNPQASVRSLCVAGDGALWFGLGEPGGIGVLRNGMVRMYGVADGVPSGVVMSLVEGRDGSIWAGGLFGVFKLTAETWVRAGEGLPPGLVNALFVDTDGSMLAATAEGVYAQRHGDQTFARIGPSDEPARALARSGDGRVWVTDPIVGFRLVSERRGTAIGAHRGRGSSLLSDSRGNLWVGTGGQGLWRVRHDESGAVSRFQRTTTMTGMSDDGVTDLLEDRDGNIWVATRDGLNRLTPHKMTPIMDLGIVNAVDVTRDGRVWVGTVDSVVAFEGGAILSRSEPMALPNPPLAAMHADERGTLWVASANELSRIVNGRREVVPLRGAAFGDLTDITSDGAGGLWLHDAQLGLWNWNGGRVTPAALPPPLQRTPLLASYTDREGRAWFAYQNGRIVQIEPSGAVRVHGEDDGLTVGPYRSIHQDAAGVIWFGGNRGLSRFAHGEFRTLPPITSTAPLPISGIVDDHSGNLWLALRATARVRPGTTRWTVPPARRAGSAIVRRSVLRMGGSGSSPDAV